MGTWDVGIFDNDTSADVRAWYEDALREDQATASSRALSHFAEDLAEPEIAPDVWFALAGTQWELGRPDPEVMRHAIALIDDGSDVERWRSLDASDEDLAERAEALAAFRDQLLAEPPPPRMPEPPPERRPVPVTRFSVGDLLGYRLPSGRWVPLAVIHVPLTFGAAPVCIFIPQATAGPPEMEVFMTADVAEDPFRTQQTLVSHEGDRPEPIADVPPEVTFRAHMLQLAVDGDADAAAERDDVELVGHMELTMTLVGHVERLGWSQLAPYLERHLGLR